MRKQKTITVNGDKIKMVISKTFSMGNFSGFTARVNGKRYHVHVLTWEEAFDKAYVRYIKENR